MTDLSATASNTPVGRRTIVKHNQTGQPRYQFEELPPEAFLNPRPGDEFFNGAPHDHMVAEVVAAFRHLLRYSPTLTVVTGTPLVWQDQSLPRPAPDLALVAHQPRDSEAGPLVDSDGHAGHLRLVIEVTSPLLAQMDTEEKRRIYQQAGVPEYVIIAPADQHDGAPPAVDLLVLREGTYQAAPSDAEGRIYCAAARAWFLVEPPDTVRLIDARTGLPVETNPDAGDRPARAESEAARRAQSIADQLDFLR
jgi:Uma2 family endonuclease